MTQLFYMIFLELIWKKRIWPVLYDPNTLPLHYIFDFKESILNLCIMPKYSTSLDTLIRRSEFLADREGLISIHRWLKNSAKGLHYFYYKGFVHLDVKWDSMLMSDEDTVVFCNFSAINLKNKRINLANFIQTSFICLICLI